MFASKSVESFHIFTTSETQVHRMGKIELIFIAGRLSGYELPGAGKVLLSQHWTVPGDHSQTRHCRPGGGGDQARGEETQSGTSGAGSRRIAAVPEKSPGRTSWQPLQFPAK